ncbi:MAG: hypothetical protein V1834_00065 [Candidatus Micrarchaeota archaeon]
MKAQASLETLLLLAAGLSFIAVLAPVVAEAGKAVDAAADASAQKSFDAELDFKVSEAELLGPGTIFNYSSRNASGSVRVFIENAGSVVSVNCT